MDTLCAMKKQKTVSPDVQSLREAQRFSAMESLNLVLIKLILIKLILIKLTIGSTGI